MRRLGANLTVAAALGAGLLAGCSRDDAPEVATTNPAPAPSPAATQAVAPPSSTNAANRPQGKVVNPVSASKPLTAHNPAAVDNKPQAAPINPKSKAASSVPNQDDVLKALQDIHELTFVRKVTESLQISSTEKGTETRYVFQSGTLWIEVSLDHTNDKKKQFIFTALLAKDPAAIETETLDELARSSHRSKEELEKTNDPVMLSQYKKIWLEKRNESIPFGQRDSFQNGVESTRPIAILPEIAFLKLTPAQQKEVIAKTPLMETIVAAIEKTLGLTTLKLPTPQPPAPPGYGGQRHNSLTTL